MSFHHGLKIHPVKLVARKYQNVLDIRLLDVSQLLADRVGCSLVPGFALVCLLSSQDFDEASSETVEPISLTHVPMETHRIELRQHINLVHA